jgi:type IV pilus assembly protein PilM
LAVFRKNKSVVGLDLGRQVVKAVEISLEGPEPVITGFAWAEIGSEEERSEAIARVFQEGRFRTKNVVTSVSGQSVVVRYITMPQMSDSELSQAIRFESDKYLPFDADEVQIDCQRLQRSQPATGEGVADGEEQMGVVLAACRNNEVQEQIEAIKSRGLSPMAIDVDVFALANAWELCGLSEAEIDETDAERAIALVDVGASGTSINVLCGGETCFSREIGIGGRDMTQAAARRLGLDPAEAEEVKCNPDGREAEISRAISPVLEDLVSEISLSLDYVENREGLRVEEVLLSGGGVMASGAVSFIEQAVGRATRTWNPLEGLRVADDRVNVEELEASAPSLAVAIGLASRVCAA